MTRYLELSINPYHIILEAIMSINVIHSSQLNTIKYSEVIANAFPNPSLPRSLEHIEEMVNIHLELPTIYGEPEDYFIDLASQINKLRYCYIWMTHNAIMMEKESGYSFVDTVCESILETLDKRLEILQEYVNKVESYSDQEFYSSVTRVNEEIENDLLEIYELARELYEIALPTYHAKYVEVFGVKPTKCSK